MLVEVVDYLQVGDYLKPLGLQFAVKEACRFCWSLLRSVQRLGLGLVVCLRYWLTLSQVLLLGLSEGRLRRLVRMNRQLVCLWVRSRSLCRLRTLVLGILSRVPRILLALHRWDSIALLQCFWIGFKCDNSSTSEACIAEDGQELVFRQHPPH